jgi:hypothetical protein|tara:strand:- start:465 stop:1016 length:552 start_codon:yes stop_codon:yes gene_type:complete
MATSIPIWANPLTEPKRQYKFILNISGIPAYVIKTVDRPSPTIGEVTHDFLIHQFKYPGKITWGDINVTMADPIDPDMSRKLLSLIKNAGYVYPGDFSPSPSDPNYYRKSLGKANMIDQIGQVTIDTMNTEGETIETWKLNNVWVKSVTYAQATYGSEELIELQMALSYDWAELESFTPITDS